MEHSSILQAGGAPLFLVGVGVNEVGHAALGQSLDAARKAAVRIAREAGVALAADARAEAFMGPHPSNGRLQALKWGRREAPILDGVHHVAELDQRVVLVQRVVLYGDERIPGGQCDLPRAGRDWRGPL